MHPLHDPQLDRDHDFLIHRFSELYGTLCWEKAEQAQTRALLEDLKRHVLDHFVREEALMRATGFPGLPKHHRAHLALRRAFTEGLARQECPNPCRQAFLQQMRERFLAHIVTWDEAFGEWLSLHPTA